MAGLGTNLVVRRRAGATHRDGGTFPFTATDEETHVYSLARRYDLKVTVRDDDGGTSGLLVTVINI